MGSDCRLEQIDDDKKDCDIEMDAANSELNILGNEIDQIEALEAATKRSVAAMVRESQERRRKEEEEEEKKRKEAENAVVAAKRGISSIAVKIRAMPADERNDEEKEWTSYDILLNPDLYPVLTNPALNEADAEVYKYDEAYKSKLSVEALRRIIVLPEPLNLALPFLRTADEMRAHYLLQKYTYERGEERLKE